MKVATPIQEEMVETKLRSFAHVRKVDQMEDNLINKLWETYEIFAETITKYFGVNDFTCGFKFQ